MEKDRLIEEIERSLGGATAGETKDQIPETHEQDGVGDPYEQALVDLKSAAREFERAGQALAAVERQLSLYPAPVLRPVLRLAQMAILVAVVAAHPLTLAEDWRFSAVPGILAFASAAAGELAGTGFAGSGRAKTLFARSSALLAMLCGSVAGAASVTTAFVLPLPVSVDWFAAAVLCLFLGSAATLPFLPARAAEQARLEERARAAHARQTKAFAEAREASERLERIHAAHLQAQQLPSQRWGRNLNGK